MSRKKLIIFPTKKQLDYINNFSIEYELYIILHNFECERVRTKKYIIISEVYFTEAIENELGTEVDVLCCHEESLYWLKKFGNKKWNYQFSTVLLDLLTKDKFKDYLFKYKILNSKYSKDINGIIMYPIIIKPIIGFGSIGVKKVNNYFELKKYEDTYNKEKLCSKIKPYQEKYFDKTDNIFIYEEYINGFFYRTPFVVLKNEIKFIFPIKGKSVTYRKNSDFHWTDFEYGNDEKKIVPLIYNVLKKLLDIFELKNGVYVAEFIISTNEDVYLLEMSPRQTSSRISKLIELATGLDLEKMAIEIFLSSSQVIKLDNCNIRMRIERDKTSFNDNKYKIVEVQEEISVYGDKIMVIYYERKCENE